MPPPHPSRPTAPPARPPVARRRRGRTALVALAALAATLVATGPAAAAPTLPDGWRTRATASGQGPYNLTDFFLTADGAMVTAGKTGRLTHVAPDGRVTTLAHLDVWSEGDAGLLGLEPTADHATTGRFHLVRVTRPDPARPGRQTVERWRLDDPARPTVAVHEATVLDGISAELPYHTVGTVAEAPDGSLYVGVGDGGDPFRVDARRALRSRDRADPHGKLLRILPDGAGHPANPWYDAGAPRAWRSRVYAVGLRNPFRFALHPESGLPIAGDVGWQDAEEVDAVRAGGDYGWPCWEGRAPTPGYRDLPECLAAAAPGGVEPDWPVWSYHRRMEPFSGGSITGGTFAAAASYPPAYRDALFFGDYSRRTLWTMGVGPRGAVTRQPEPGAAAVVEHVFGRGAAPVRFRTGPDGTVHWADILTGEVHQLLWTPGNRPPVAQAYARTAPGSLEVQFSSAGAYDPDGGPLTFRWDFGDGSDPRGGPTPAHTYADGTAREVTLTVTDDQGLQDTHTLTVVPGNGAPRLDLRAPGPDTTFAVGERMTLAAAAADPEDGDLTAAVSWQAFLDHCSTPTSCHVHPAQAGVGGTFALDFAGHGEGTSVRVVATVRDAAGATHAVTWVAPPRRRRLRLSSWPAGAPLTLDGRAQPPEGTLVTVGLPRTVAAPAASDDRRFADWSDGGARTHEVVMPDRDLDLHAVFRGVVDRAAGPHRVATAVAVSAATFHRADVAVLARADDPADALVAGPLAASLDAPLLLAWGGRIDDEVLGELDRLGAKRVVVVGGERAVPRLVVEKLATVGYAVDRVAGADRFATAREVAVRVGGDEAYVVEGLHPDPGRGWPDAVSASGAASLRRQPVLLVTADHAPGSTLRALEGRSTAWIVGGERAVGVGVAAAIDAEAGTVRRLGGSDRFATSRAVAAHALAVGGAGDALWAATGRDWPDALVAGRAAGADGAALWLVDGRAPSLSPDERDWLDGVAAGVVAARVAGGPAAVGTPVLDGLREVLRPRWDRAG